jgi:hypothetical protein
LLSRHRQSGVALLIALIALAAMAMAGIALIRSVDTNVLVASNMAFRTTARESTDAGVEAARNWLISNSSTLANNGGSDTGYYALRMGIDLTSNTGGTTTVNWKNNNGESTGGSFQPACLAGRDAANNVVCYVIQRMCDSTGTFSPHGSEHDRLDFYNKCDTVIISGGGGGCQSLECGELPKPQASVGIVYRVTIRAASLRNNFSYVQAFIILPS